MLDLEYERIELIKFNLFDNSGTYQAYVMGRDGVAGPALKTWPEMRLPASNPDYQAVGGDGPQVCSGELIRARTLTGICNDIRNPLMGSTGMPFARNVEFETTFPDLEQTTLTKNRHGGRIGLLTPDPQVISRVLFTRAQSNPAACNLASVFPAIRADANCDYQKAPFFNVLAAYWIQFMTHDWFSHMDEGHNAPGTSMEVGCKTKLVNGVPDAAHAGGDSAARLPPRRPGRQDLCAGRLRARHVHRERQDLSDARAQDLSPTTTPPGGTPRSSTASTTLR